MNKQERYTWLMIARGLKDRGLLVKQDGAYVVKPEMGQLYMFPDIKKESE